MGSRVVGRSVSDGLSIDGLGEMAQILRENITQTNPRMVYAVCATGGGRQEGNAAIRSERETRQERISPGGGGNGNVKYRGDGKSELFVHKRFNLENRPPNHPITSRPTEGGRRRRYAKVYCPRRAILRGLGVGVIIFWDTSCPQLLLHRPNTQSISFPTGLILTRQRKSK